MGRGQATIRIMLILLLAVIPLPLTFAAPSDIQFTEEWGTDNLTVEAWIANADGLASATLYIIEEKSRNVVWTEHRILQGTEANLSFFWPGQIWRITNGTYFVEPVLVVNTIDLPAQETPYLTYSAPCLLILYPGEQEITSLAYFDSEGRFHSLRDLSEIEYYKSRELLWAVSPGTSWGRYVRSNVTLQVGQTALRFLWLNLDQGLSTFPPVVLDRSPIQHYSIQLLRRAANPGTYVVEIEAEDMAGNKTVRFSGSPDGPGASNR